MVLLAAIDSNGIIFLEMGLILVFSIFTAFFLKKFGIPAVLGLILGGLIIGILTGVRGYEFAADLGIMHIFITELALGWIGFGIGDEVDLALLKNQGKALMIVLLGESLGAFLVVTIVMTIVLDNIGVAIILGSIAMATAPAATSQVLGEYKAEGELTQTLLFILAFDDILAILFVNFSLNYVIGTSSGIMGLIDSFILVFFELFVSVIFGIVMAVFVLNFVGRVDKKNRVGLLLGVALITMGIVLILESSVILTMFMFGVVLKTLEEKETKRMTKIEEVLSIKDEFGTDCLPKEELISVKTGFGELNQQIEILMTPIVLLFFIFVGLLMDINLIFGVTLFYAIFYFLTRAIGKTIGSISAGNVSNMADSVKKNLPFCLITQAGVAIGLAGLAFNELVKNNMLHEAELVINIVGVSVILAEIIGPILVKYAIIRSGEAQITQ